MDNKVMEEMTKLIEKYFGPSELHGLLKDFVQEKVKEKSLWSEITLCTHFMFGGKSPQIYKIGAFVELVILSLDMLDDLQDDDQADKPWMKSGKENTMNAIVGLLMAVIADATECKSNSETISKITTSSIIKAIYGQHKDINNSIVSEEDYIKMIKEKSGSLIQFACEMGIVCLDFVENDLKNKISELALNIGVMAQIENDIEDMLKLDVKNDILQRKKTLPIMYLLSVSKQAFPELLEYYDGTISQAEILKCKKELLEFIYNSGAIEYANTIKMLYQYKADHLFKILPTQFPWNEDFKKLIFK